MIPTPPAYVAGPFTCTVPVLDTSVSSSGSFPSVPVNGQSDIDLFGDLHRDFAAEGAFTLPEQKGNRGLFYSNWALLVPLKRQAFVQVELMRWKRFTYREEIAITWRLENGPLVYRDTGIFVTDVPHRLGISVHEGSIGLDVDGRQICSAPFSVFFSPDERLYFQLGTEVSAYGDRPIGTLSDIKLKTDDDAALNTITPKCIYRGYGTSWEYDGNGVFHASGVFDPSERYLRFTGLYRDQPCNF